MLVLDVEDLGVAGGGGGDESSVKELEDFVADVGELRLDPGQKALPKWVAIRVESGLRSGLRCQSGLRSGSSRLRSGFYVCVCVCVCFFFCDQWLKEEVGITKLGMGLIWMVAEFYLCSFFLSL